MFRWIFKRETRAAALLVGGWLLMSAGWALYLGRGAFLILVGVLLLGLVGWRVAFDFLWLGSIGEQPEPTATSGAPRQVQRRTTPTFLGRNKVLHG